jgi:hypothetical protein
VSPTFFIHLVIVPSAMDSPICGMITSVAIALLSPSQTPLQNSIRRSGSMSVRRCPGVGPLAGTRRPVTEIPGRRWSLVAVAVRRTESGVLLHHASSGRRLPPGLQSG